MTTYGLPRHVVTFLRHMEAYKELLKWDICEGSHKITLRLSWNFRKHIGRETLWSKLQRTMKLSRSHESTIPEDLSHFLDRSPRKSDKSSSHFSPRLSWARISSISLPSRWRQNHSPSTSANRNSMRTSKSLHTPLQHTSPSRMSLPISPSRYSWPGTGNTSVPDELPDHTLNSPITSTPDSTRSEGLPGTSRIRISYRMEDDIAQSIENIAEKVHQQKKAELGTIQKEWDDAIKNWDKEISDEEQGLVGNTSSEQMTDSEQDVNLQQVNQTVKSCLKTCDSILDKHSTLIL